MQTFDLINVPLEGRTLVEASAGTGKTYAISTLFLRLLLEKGLSVEQILVVTFTEAATSELKRRIRDRLRSALDLCDSPSTTTRAHDTKPDPILVAVVQRQNRADCQQRLSDALRDFDRASILTIHAFCARVLQDNAFQTGSTFSAELLTDTREIVADAVLDYWAHQVTPIPSALAQYLFEKKWRPSQLSRFSQWIAQTRPLAVVPGEQGTLADLDSRDFELAFARAKAAFDIPSLDALLRGSNLHKGKFPPAKLGAWFDELRAYFDARRINVRPPACTWRLLPTQLEAARTRATGSRNLEHPFVTALLPLKAEFDRLDAELARQFLRLKSELVEWLQREIPKRKRELGVVSFDDLLHQVHDAVVGPGGHGLGNSLRSEFPAALIDEFQDTDPTQYTIFDQVYRAPQSTLFLIGDPKQAIYSFRGADVFAYLRAAEDVPESHQHTMATNHRSDPALIEAVNRLFLQCPNPFYVNTITYPAVGARPDARVELSLDEGLDKAPLQLRFIPRSLGEGGLNRSFKHRRLPELVANELLGHLDSKTRISGRALRPQDFAILTRTNEEAFECQRALLERGVPAVVLGDRSVYEQPEASELLLLLKAIAEPGNVRALRTALVTETLGLDAHELLALDQDEVAWDRWADRFRRWHERWFQYGFVQMMHQLLSDCSLPSRLLGLRDGERRMTNLMQLIELLHTRASDHHLGPRGVLHYLWEQLNERLVASDSEQVRLESDADAVVLTTIHKSKGLEYPIVLCPTLFNPTAVFGGEAEWPRFHDEQHSHRLTLDLGGPELKEHAALMQEEALAENLRLLYVALTRAKHRCIVFWGAFFKFQTSALAYLLHGPVATGDDEETSPGAEKLDDQALLQRLLELDPSAEQIGVHAVDRDAKDLSRPQQLQGNRQLTCLRSERVRQIWERTASFSSLTAGAAHRLDPLDGRDYDPQQAPVERPPRTSEVLTTLATFPGGTTTGNFFHSVLEHSDFRGPDFDSAVQRALIEHGPPEGLSAEQSTQLVLSALGEITRARFSKNISLADIAPAERLNEMEFYLPAPRLRDHRAITCERLAAAFRDHPSPAVPNSYADSLLGLDFAPLSGFLKGFIDLVFEHRGRWYVVDYKTNNLGPNYSDYAAAELRAPMASSHYILQYHLYCLAVHRYLSLRHPNYSYEQDFGGSYYLFLRGMHPEHSPKTGVFFEKPPLGRISALAELFSAQHPSQGPGHTHAGCCK